MRQVHPTIMLEVWWSAKQSAQVEAPAAMQSVCCLLNSHAQQRPTPDHVPTKLQVSTKRKHYT